VAEGSEFDFENPPVFLGVSCSSSEVIVGASDVGVVCVEDRFRFSWQHGNHSEDLV